MCRSCQMKMTHVACTWIGKKPQYAAEGELLLNSISIRIPHLSPTFLSLSSLRTNKNAVWASLMMILTSFRLTRASLPLFCREVSANEQTQLKILFSLIYSRTSILNCKTIKTRTLKIQCPQKTTWSLTRVNLSLIWNSFGLSMTFYTIFPWMMKLRRLIVIISCHLWVMMRKRSTQPIWEKYSRLSSRKFLLRSQQLIRTRFNLLQTRAFSIKWLRKINLWFL